MRWWWRGWRTCGPKDSATFVTEGGRAAASLRVRDALDTLGGQLREGYNFINGLLSFVITKADKLDLFIKYGWLQGEMAALEVRYFWWLILLVALAVWLIWGVGRKPKE